MFIVKFFYYYKLVLLKQIINRILIFFSVKRVNLPFRLWLKYFCYIGDMIWLEILTYQNTPLLAPAVERFSKSECKLPLMWCIPVYLIRTTKKIVQCSFRWKKERTRAFLDFSMDFDFYTKNERSLQRQ